MSKILHAKKIQDKIDGLKRENKKSLISFIVMGIIQVVYFAGAFFLGRFIGYFEHNDSLYYPYNRNAKQVGALGLILAGVINAIYIAFNKRASLKNKKWNLGMKVAIPITSWSLSEFIIYRLGYSSSIPLWDHVSTLYGVYDRRKTP